MYLFNSRQPLTQGWIVCEQARVIVFNEIFLMIIPSWRILRKKSAGIIAKP